MDSGPEHPRFVVIGAFVADCTVNTPCLPVWGETYEAQAVRTSPGGKALNQTVALGRLGAHVTPVGVVGDDAHGKEILGVLDSEGAYTHGVQMRQAAETSTCVCLIGDDGRTSFMWHVSQEVAITPENIQDAAPAIEEAHAVLVTIEDSAAAAREAIELAHRHGCMVVVQPAPPLRNPGPSGNAAVGPGRRRYPQRGRGTGATTRQ